jgi:hypothetical protein
MANDFNAAINEIMPLVEDGDKSTPFIITRDSAYGDWQVCYPYPAENAAKFLTSQREHDPFAVMFTGEDFARGSFPSVYDKVLTARVRAEYDAVESSVDHDGDFHALTCFFEDRIGEFSHKLTDYLTTINRPLITLYEMCPYSMATDRDGWQYEEELTSDAIHYIESEVSVRLYNRENKSEARYILGYEEKQSVQIGKITIALAENLKAESPYLVCNLVNDEAYHQSAFPGYVSAMREFLTRQTTLINTFEAERENLKERGVDSVMLTAAHCLPDSEEANFTGKLIIVKASELSPEYRYADSQLVECTHGNGARPDAIGRSVFCKELYSGDSVVFDRSQILGVADEGKLPQWAKTKLEIQRDPAVFEYGGYHFKPHRKFERRDGDFNKQMNNAASDRSMGISSYEWGKTEYSHAKFYEAARESEADIFKCLENGKLYIPAANELFRYNEPPQKEQAKAVTPQKPARAEEKPQRKPSILSDLDDAIAEAAQIAERKGGSHTKKRGDMEVD